MTMSHSELVERGRRWLKNQGCKPIFCEPYCLGHEHPDVIGWINSTQFSIIIECKTSVTDFYADSRKYSRQYPPAGMGFKRYYLCPKGVIEPNRIKNESWGLLWAYPKQIRIQREAVGFDSYAKKEEMRLILYKIRQMDWERFDRKKNRKRIDLTGM